jgi:hypothetical protein
MSPSQSAVSRDHARVGSQKSAVRVLLFDAATKRRLVNKKKKVCIRSDLECVNK